MCGACGEHVRTRAADARARNIAGAVGRAGRVAAAGSAGRAGMDEGARSPSHATRRDAGGGIGSSPPQPEHAPRTDPWEGRGYERGVSQAGSVRGGGRGGPKATGPDPICPDSRGMCQPINGRPAT
eukprot:5051944-Pleurochrysis_carterae.AAC.1